MRGHEYARVAVRDRLMDVLPTRLAALRSELEVTAPENPPERGYLLADVLPTDPGMYPCVVVMSTAAPSLRQLTVAAQGDEVDYIVRYDLRVVVACRSATTGGDQAASVARDRLLLAVRESLMTRTPTPDDLDIEASSITEQTGAAAQDLKGTPLAAGEITVSVKVVETLRPIPTPEPIEGTAVTVAVTSHADPHPDPQEPT